MKNPFRKQFVLPALVVSILTASAASWTVAAEPRVRPFGPVTTTVTYPAVAVGAGQGFVFRLTCTGTLEKTPCQATVQFLGEQGEVVQAFDPVDIEEGESKEFSLLVPFNSKAILRVVAEVFALRPNQKRLLANLCCCQDRCDETPSVVEVTNEETGETSFLVMATGCIRAAGGQRK